MPPKVDPNEIKVIHLRATGGEVGASSALAPKIGPLGLSPKKVGEDIAKATGDWKGLRVTVKLTIQNRQAAVSVVPSASSLVIRALKEPPRDRKKEKNIKHTKSIPLDEIITIARTMRFKSMAKELKGTVKEILGTAFSVGCQVDGRSPKDVNDDIDKGEIETLIEVIASYENCLDQFIMASTLFQQSAFPQGQPSFFHPASDATFIPTFPPPLYPSRFVLRPPPRVALSLHRPAPYPGNGFRPNNSLQQLSRQGAEHILRRKTPSGTLAAGYDGTPKEWVSRPYATKHMVLSGTRASRSYVSSDARVQPSQSFPPAVFLPAPVISPSPYPADDRMIWSPTVAVFLDAMTTHATFGSSIACVGALYPRTVDSMLNQGGMLQASPYYAHNGAPSPHILDQSGLGSTTSNPEGPWGPYWPDGAFIPYRPAAVREVCYQPPTGVHGPVAGGLVPSQSTNHAPWLETRRIEHALLPSVYQVDMPAGMCGQAMDFEPASLGVVPQAPVGAVQQPLLGVVQAKLQDYHAVRRPQRRRSPPTRFSPGRVSPRRRKSQSVRSAGTGATIQPPVQPYLGYPPTQEIGSTANDPNLRLRSHQFKDKLLVSAHSAYVNLLASLHQAGASTNDDAGNTAHPDPNLPKVVAKNAAAVRTGRLNSSFNLPVLRRTARVMAKIRISYLALPVRSPNPKAVLTTRDFNPPGQHLVSVAAANAAKALDVLGGLCVESNWKWIDGMLLAGCLAYGLGRYDDALVSYSKILELDASHVEAISNLAATLLSLHRRDEAEQYWLKSVKLRPSYFEAVEHLVGLLCGDHRGKEAVSIIEYVEESLRYVKPGDTFKPSDADDETESVASNCSSRAASDFSDKPFFEADLGDEGLRFVCGRDRSLPPGYGSSGYAIPGSENGRILALVHAKGNMLYALGDNDGAARAFAEAVLIAAGRRSHGIHELIERIVVATAPVGETELSISPLDPPSPEPVLLLPEQALHTARLVFPRDGQLPGLRHIPGGIAAKAALSTTSNALLSLAKIFQDGMSAGTTTGPKTPCGVRDILALYYLSLALQPSPSTANNVGILLAGLQHSAPPKTTSPMPSPTASHPLASIPGVVPGSGVALALAYYNYGLNLDAKHAHLFTNLGSLLKDLGQLTAAVKMYEQAVACDGTFDIALANLANAVKDQGRIVDTIHYYRRAVAASPDFAEAVCGLANALGSVCSWTGRGGDAVLETWHVDDEGMLVRPEMSRDVRAGWMRRVVDIVERQLAEGEHWGKGVLRSHGVGHLLAQLERPTEDDPTAAARRQRLEKALTSWAGQAWEGARVLRLIERGIQRIGWQWYQDKHIWNQEDTSRWRYARPQLPSTLSMPTTPTVLPFHTFTCPLSAQQIRMISQRNALRISYSTLRSPWLPTTVFEPPAPPAPHLNVGYVSSDFNNHPLAHLMQSVFGLHHPERVRAFCYATSPGDNSSHREQIEREAPVFYDATSWSTERLVTQIVHDGIHILVNLNGYTRGARNDIFAARPAPIQMSFMGFAGTLGAEWCDYLLADETAVPPDTLRPWRRNVDLEDQLAAEASDAARVEAATRWVYAENLIYARDTFFCCDHRQSAPDAKEERLSWEAELARRRAMRLELFPDMADDVVILGNFNQLYKIDPTTFRTWLRILSRVPNTVLWLLRFPDLGESELRQMALRWAGSDVAARIVFTDVAPKHLHISRARVCDLFLDTPECNAHTTAADVLWSGTPILTLPRYPYKMCSRMAASILRGALPRGPVGDQAAHELIASSEDQYESFAVALARSLAYDVVPPATAARAATATATVAAGPGTGQGTGRLLELRRMLYEGRWTSALFDTARWVEDLERAYDMAWAKWVAGEGGDIWL
ncbi:MAG: hypothetical protein M1826_007344 [Phylliscum demangeonii]|nr:MAG: hypothetical protein M1826_007344 [Phylliscum demangeonii]